jgi:phage-related minor tail protein
MIGLPLGSITAFLLQKVGIGEISIKIDEDLANYFDACEREDREDNVKEEQNLRATYNVKLQNDDGLLRY